jgi:hypothetical protein
MASSLNPPRKSKAGTKDSDRKAPAGDLKRYGITRVPTEHFEYGGYRYSSLEHAVAEARRREARGDPR